MKEEEIKEVYKAIENFGDDFWNDSKEAFGEGPEASNKELFRDILKYLEKAGYDLQLIKIKPIGKPKIGLKNNK